MKNRPAATAAARPVTKKTAKPKHTKAAPVAKRDDDDPADSDDDASVVKPQHTPTTGKFHIDKRSPEILAADAAKGDDDDLLTTPELALWWDISTQWLEIGRHRGYGPPFVMMAPGMIRYRRGTLKEWLKEREFTCTAQYRSASKTGVEA